MIYHYQRFHTIQDDIDLKQKAKTKSYQGSFHTIQDDIDLKRYIEYNNDYSSFHTIQDDIDLKPQIINLYPYYHRVIILYEW